jgi:hypothetical protein
MSNPDREHLPIPTVLTPETFVSFCLVLPRDSEHLAAFWGAVQALAHRYTWGKPLTADSETVAAYWLNLIDENRVRYEDAIMSSSGSGCCCDDPIYRFTSEGIREVSHDGGETWEVDPGDPRVSGNVLPPPPWLLTPGGHECEGAITGANNMHAMMDEILSTGSVALSSLYETIAAIICVFSAGTACLAAELISAVAVIITNLTSTYIDSVLTDAVYDQLKCFLFCHIEPDATFTEAGWLSVKSDINEQIANLDARFVLWQMVNAMGAAGMTNLCRLSVTVTGDCDECDCDTCGDGVHLGAQGTNLTDLGAGVWTIEGTADGEGNTNALVWLSESETGCCDVGEQIALVGAVTVGFVIDCDGVFSTTGFPIPAGCYRWIGWRNPAGAAFTVQFELNPCP